MTLAPDHLLRRIDPRGAPPDLRVRALAAARAGRQNAESVDLWTRVWTNRPLRLAWAASLAALLIAHVALSLRSVPGPEPRPVFGGAYLIASTVPDDELRAFVELPSIATDTLPSTESPTLDTHG